MEQKLQYIVRCWHCTAQYDAVKEPFCSHRDPTKICPFCLRCFCEAPDDYKADFIMKSPKELLSEKIRLQGRKDMRLGELLIIAGKINEDQLKVAIAKQNILKRRKKRLGEILVMMKLISPDELLLFLEKQKGLDEINLKNFELDFELVNRIGKNLCLKNTIIPIEVYERNDENFFRFASSSREKIAEIIESKELRRYVMIPYLADKEYVELLLDEMKGEGK